MNSLSLLTPPRDRFTAVYAIRIAAIHAEANRQYALADRLFTLYERGREQLVKTDLANWPRTR